MRNTLFVAALVAVAVPAFASDGGPAYSYIDVNYVNYDFDGGGSADGFGVTGSYAINEQFHVLGDIARVSDSGVSVTMSTLAGGYAYPISGTTDFVGRLGIVHARVGVSGFGSASDDGWMAQAGVRSMLSSDLELNGFVTHADVGGSETGLSLGLVKGFSERVGGVAGVAFADGDVALNLGVRFSF